MSGAETESKPDTYTQEFKRTHPKLASRAMKSPLPAIRMFCILCFGGNRGHVESCTAPECPLYPFRMGHRPKDPDKPQVKRAAPQALLDHIQRKREAKG